MNIFLYTFQCLHLHTNSEKPNEENVLSDREANDAIQIMNDLYVYLCMYMYVPIYIYIYMNLLMYQYINVYISLYTFTCLHINSFNTEKPNEENVHSDREAIDAIQIVNDNVLTHVICMYISV
jgi:hypothetical protein